MHDLGRAIFETDRMVGEAESAEHREFLEVLGGLLRGENAPRRSRRQEHEVGGAARTGRARKPPAGHQVRARTSSPGSSVILRSAVRSGMTDENQLANLIFFRRHPERNGRLLSRGEPNFQQLSQEWLRIRDTLVRPALRGTPTAPPDAGAAPVSCMMPGPRAGLTILPELDAICAIMSAAGHPTRIGSGRRTIDDQIQLYAKGRTFAEFKAKIEEAVTAGEVTKAKCTQWVNYFDPAQGNHPMPPGESGPVTWTFSSRHLTGDAADVVHQTLGWGASKAFWTALNAAAVAQGLQIGPPANDYAHVQRP